MSLLLDNILKDLITDDFPSLPRIKQIEGFLKCLYDADHTKVTPQEITQLFKDVNMKSPQRSKTIRCGSFKVKEYLDSMTDKNSAVCVNKIADNLYKISIKS